MSELEQRRLPFEKIDSSSHGFDPRDRVPRYSVVVNRTSPSSHTRGHGQAVFYAEPLLEYFAGLGIPVINPVRAWRFEKSKAMQADLLERLGVLYPRTVIVNHRDQIPKAADRLRFPVLLKPNVGGSGAGIVRFDAQEELEGDLAQVAFGPDGVALLQEYQEPREGAIVRIEMLDGEYLYAIRIVRETGRFNLCPADLCQVPAPGAADLAACPVTVSAGLSVTRFDAPAEAIEIARRLTRAASIDVGGVEYLVSETDGRTYFYDVNATSNFVANAPAVLGFDPFPRFVEFITRVATSRRAA
jgi:glutathione synthase/RimK-type ligase-like ATP-grasp enzyme